MKFSEFTKRAEYTGIVVNPDAKKPSIISPYTIGRNRMAEYFKSQMDKMPKPQKGYVYTPSALNATAMNDGGKGLKQERDRMVSSIVDTNPAFTSLPSNLKSMIGLGLIGRGYRNANKALGLPLSEKQKEYQRAEDKALELLNEDTDANNKAREEYYKVAPGIVQNARPSIYKQSSVDKSALSMEELGKALKDYGRTAWDYAQKNPELTAAGVGIGSGLLAALTSPRGRKLVNFLRWLGIGGGTTYAGLALHDAYKLFKQIKAERGVAAARSMLQPPNYRPWNAPASATERDAGGFIKNLPGLHPVTDQSTPAGQPPVSGAKSQDSAMKP